MDIKDFPNGLPEVRYSYYCEGCDQQSDFDKIEENMDIMFPEHDSVIRLSKRNFDDEKPLDEKQYFLTENNHKTKKTKYYKIILESEEDWGFLEKTISRIPVTLDEAVNYWNERITKDCDRVENLLRDKRKFICIGYYADDDKTELYGVLNYISYYDVESCAERAKLNLKKGKHFVILNIETQEVKIV